MKKTNPKIERVLSLVEPSRRDAMRKILVAAYSAPMIASFSLDSLAQVPPSCLAANQTGVQTNFAGTVTCSGVSRTNGGSTQDVDLTFAVTLQLCELSLGGVSGAIQGGPATLVTSSPASVIGAAFEGRNNDTLGFFVDVGSTYREAGRWTHSINKKGEERLRGTSNVVVTNPLSPVGTSYNLECDYDLSSI